jgi:hypothetical protein
MNRERWQELASEYIEGTLSDEMRVAVERHLSEDAESREEADALRGLFAELKQLPEVEPPLFFADNVMSRIQRESEARRPWWSSWLGIGRTASATLVLGGAAAGIAWVFLAPQPTPPSGGGLQQARTALLPGRSEAQKAPGDPAALSAPELRIERTLRMEADAPSAYDFAVALENAPGGTARFTVPGDPTPYRFTFRAGKTGLLQVPLVSARDSQTMALRCDWSAEGRKHVKYLLVPLPEAEKTDSVKLSFGLGEMPLPETARVLAARYGRPITLEDVPESLRLAVVARAETLEEVLARHLKGTELRVTSSPSGVLVAPAR